MRIDAYDLWLLPRDGPLTVHANASGFTCAICGAQQESHAWRVTLPKRAGLACPGCANDRGWDTR